MKLGIGSSRDMKLTSLRSGRDGELVVVSRDLRYIVRAGSVARTLQVALDDWEATAPRLEAIYTALNAGKAQGALPIEWSEVGPPLPRAYQYLDGAAYVSHIKRNRAARGEALPDDLMEKPLVYKRGYRMAFSAGTTTFHCPPMR